MTAQKIMLQKIDRIRYDPCGHVEEPFLRGIFDYCPECGQCLTRQEQKEHLGCSRCHNWVKESYKYCPFCGTKFSSEVETFPIE